mgnify:CR=1 FL=1
MRISISSFQKNNVIIAKWEGLLMYIKDDEINKYFNEPNWKVAHNLFQHNTISNMSVIKDGQIYQIVGSTNVNGKIDTATIQVDTGGHILEFTVIVITVSLMNWHVDI